MNDNRGKFKKLFRGILRHKLFRFLLIPAILLIVFVFLFYGPFKSFKYFWINSAMHTSRFQFLAKMFYSEDYINSVIGKIEPGDNPKTDDSVLPHNWDDKITFAPIKGNNYKGYIIKINDPRRLIFTQATSRNGNLLEDFVIKNEALGGINASGYASIEQKGIAWGTTISGGEIIVRCTQNDHHVMGGFTKDYKLVIGGFTEEEIKAKEYLWAFEFFPILIANGQKTEFQPFSGGYAPRTAIGQTAQGHVLLLVVDGRQRSSLGATFEDLQTILYENGAVNAINLDGGSSSSMFFNGRLVNSPSDGEKERLLPNAILFQ
ncbi:MAG: phosphodiester glycosidase family protein [Treponema sp.]|nr:phosphodiester glycosidase family protein [Treponema sp.]